MLFQFFQSMEVCDAVYKADWTILKSRPMKNLVIIMMRSFRPVKMSSGYLVTLTIGSFMSVGIRNEIQLYKYYDNKDNNNAGTNSLCSFLRYRIHLIIS